jgi:hypothetical protein
MDNDIDYQLLDDLSNDVHLALRKLIEAIQLEAIDKDKAPSYISIRLNPKVCSTGNGEIESNVYLLDADSKCQVINGYHVGTAIKEWQRRCNYNKANPTNHVMPKLITDSSKKSTQF